jgi:hypothetical protein
MSDDTKLSTPEQIDLEDYIEGDEVVMLPPPDVVAMGDYNEPISPSLDAMVRIAAGEANCGDCLFYFAETRECRKSPPPRGSGQPFPVVPVTAWCGEYLDRQLFMPD